MEQITFDNLQEITSLSDEPVENILTEEDIKKIEESTKNGTISVKKDKQYRKLKEKYMIHEKFIIAREARKTIRYIEKNTTNFPNKYNVLKSRIINSGYDMLKAIYRANITLEKEDKLQILIEIEMLNFYLEEALRNELINDKKFVSYGNFLLNIDLMVRKWAGYEASK